MRWLLILLLVLLLGLQTRLWVGEGSLAHKAELDKQLDSQEDVNQQLRERNEFIAKDLGMIKGGEVFYLVTDQDPRLPTQITTKEVDSP
jgi:cell division protein FtsB